MGLSRWDDEMTRTINLATIPCPPYDPYLEEEKILSKASGKNLFQTAHGLSGWYVNKVSCLKLIRYAYNLGLQEGKAK